MPFVLASFTVGCIVIGTPMAIIGYFLCEDDPAPFVTGILLMFLSGMFMLGWALLPYFVTFYT